MKNLVEREPALPGSQIERAADPRPLASRVARLVPGCATLVALAGVGWFGHRTDWKMPSFSQLLGNAASQKDDWCDQHAVPGSICVECNPGLAPTPKPDSWCQLHGVHVCPHCDPSAAQLIEPPHASPADLARIGNALAARPRLENNRGCTLYQRRIQFASLEDMLKVGVDVAIAAQRPMVEGIPANAEVNYDRTRLAHQAARLPGIVFRVEKQVGDRVQEGEVLALIDAAEVGKAKAEWLSALADLRLEQNAWERLSAIPGVVSERRQQEAEAAFSQARTRLASAEQALANLDLPVDAAALRHLADDQVAERLRFLGLPEALIAQVDQKTATANLIPIKAAFNGVVTRCDAVKGEIVDTTTVLFELADTSTLWLTLHVRQEDARYLELDQPIEFRPDGDDQSVKGRIDWISTRVDEVTRTVDARANLENPAGNLRANTFGTGTIVLRQESQAVAVPSEAVHWDGSCSVVFVRDKRFFEKGSPKYFHTRTVRLGTKDDRFTELIAGVLPGEIVASTGSAVLRAALLKNNLGAG